jgi:ADP-ribosyl-[dinitrogen reductase] hydrolase
MVETLQAVFQAFFAHDNLETILIDVVNRGGDADTTGAIAGMLAGACHGVDAIPRRWLRALDREVRTACEDQALALLELARTADWGRGCSVEEKYHYAGCAGPSDVHQSETP